MLLRVLLLFALLPPPADCWLGQQMAPPERCSLRCCDDAGEQPPAALRNVTPAPALVRPDGLSGSADCGAMSFDMQPVINKTLGVASCVRPPEKQKGCDAGEAGLPSSSKCCNGCPSATSVHADDGPCVTCGCVSDNPTLCCAILDCGCHTLTVEQPRTVLLAAPGLNGGDVSTVIYSDGAPLRNPHVKKSVRFRRDLGLRKTPSWRSGRCGWVEQRLQAERRDLSHS